MEGRGSKWPDWVKLIRHGQSSYNARRHEIERHPVFKQFVEWYDKDPAAPITHELAAAVHAELKPTVGDWNTPLTDHGWEQATTLGCLMRDSAADGDGDLPDFIIVSPHIRTRQTLEGLIKGWPELDNGVARVEELRLREQEHGLANLFIDKRVFWTLYPDQKALYDMEGPFWYRYPNGESIANVFDRVHSFIGTIVREYRGRKVMIVTHHVTIMAFRYAIERWTYEDFIDFGQSNPPRNCSVTTFAASPNFGLDGRLAYTSYTCQVTNG